MINQKTVMIRWNGFTKQHYINLGYNYTKCGEWFEVRVCDLPDNSRTRVNVICDYCNKPKDIDYADYIKTTKNQTEKYCCKNCIHDKLHEKYFEQTREKYYGILKDKCEEFGHILLSPIDDYKNAYSHFKIVCPVHGELSVTYNDYIHSKNGCKYCGYEETKKKLALPQDVVKEIVESKNENILLNPEEYINTSTKNLKVLCGSCKKIFITSLSSINGSKGMCSKCGYDYESELMKLSPEEVETRINSVNGNTLLNVDEYESTHTKNLRVLCSCNREFIVSLQDYTYFNVNRCPICTKRTSKGELDVSVALDKLQIKYISEYKFDDCYNVKPLPFDFYLPDYNTCVEFDGQYHYFPIHGEDTLKATQERDKIKTDYCLKNDIHLIRIPFWEGSKIEEIIKQELNLGNN